MQGAGAEPHRESSSGPEALVRRIGTLEARLAAVEARLAALEQPASAVAAPAPAEPVPHGPIPADPSLQPLSLLALAGRLCLVFAGAFLVRSLTDSGAVPKGVGVLLGLGYGGFLCLAADRAAHRGKAALGSALLISTTLIVYPLLWEATLGFKVLAPPAAALAMALVAGGLIAVAWRGGLQGAAWIAALGAAALGLGLMVATAAVEAFAAAFLAMGGAVLWLTYGRRWQDLRWPLALAADLAVLTLAVLASWPGGPPEAYRDLSAPRALGLALALVMIYLGSFVARILLRRRELVPFEGVQGALALLVGFGGALRIAHGTGHGLALLAVAALVVGAACYGAAYAFVEKQSEGGRNFLFFTTLALVLVATGGLVLLGGAGMTWPFIGLGLVSTTLGRRHGRWTLLAHGSLYLAGAAVTSRLVPRALGAFLAAPGLDPSVLAPAPVAALLALAAVHGALTSGAEEASWVRRLPSFTAGLLAALGVGAVVVQVLDGLLPGRPPGAAALAGVRTVVLSAAALGIGLLARRWPRTELRWLVYPILAVAGAKWMLLDLPLGRPLTLFPSLAVYGAALLLAPRLLRGGAAGREADGGG